MNKWLNIISRSTVFAVIGYIRDRSLFLDHHQNLKIINCLLITDPSYLKEKGKSLKHDIITVKEVYNKKKNTVVSANNFITKSLVRLSRTR